MGIADQNSFGTLTEVETPQIMTISPASASAGVIAVSISEYKSSVIYRSNYDYS